MENIAFCNQETIVFKETKMDKGLNFVWKKGARSNFPEMNPNFWYEKKLYQCHFGCQALKLRNVHYEKLNLKITGGIKNRTKRAKMLELLTFIQFVSRWMSMFNAWNTSFRFSEPSIMHITICT